LELKRQDKGIMMFCGGGGLIEYLLLNIGRGEKWARWKRMIKTAWSNKLPIQ
jgi:hypothetical protein